jgi:hypothetical protein
MPALARLIFFWLSVMYWCSALKPVGSRSRLPTSVMGTSATWPMKSRSVAGLKRSERESAGSVDMPMLWISSV